MRTTLTLRDELYEAARRRAFEERRTLGDVVNELIELGLSAASTPTERRFGTFSGQIVVAQDFDEPVPELDASVGEPVDR
jgi:hypothetical protein